MKQFVQKLEDKRGNRSIREFSKELGIDHSFWSRVLRGEREPGKLIINAALARWPELAYWLAADAQAAQEDNTEPAA